MRALLLPHHGGPESLRVDDVPDPSGTDLVHVDVLAAGVSRPDVLLMRGQYQSPVAPPFVPGAEVCGLVTQAPRDSGLEVGERVVALVPAGGWAERVALPLPFVRRAPAPLDDLEAAALPVNALTAWFALVERAGLRAGETVVVLGAAGGLGSAAVQVAHALGARVVAVVRRPGADDTIRSWGADAVVPLAPGWAGEVRDAARGAVGVVIDPVGGDAFDDALRVLAPGGRLVSLGFSGGGIPSVALNRLLLRNVAVLGAGFAEFLRHDLSALDRAADGVWGLVTDGLRPHVGLVGPLEDGPAVVSALDAGDVVGKAVLRVGTSNPTPDPLGGPA